MHIPVNNQKRHLIMTLKFLSTIQFFLVVTVLALLSACQSQPLRYQLDPEFNSIMGQNSKIIALKIKDNRSSESSKTTNNLHISGPKNIELSLQQKITTQIKQSGHKIINNPLLADYAIELKVNRLDIIALPSTFKSTLIAKNEFQLTINQQGKQWTKIFKGSKSQDVVNPVSSSDATGVINQLLSQQLTKAFSSESLKQFLLANGE